MSNYHDIDFYGRENADGSALELLDDFAVDNALLNYITSKRGDFLMNPEWGGVLDVTTFKNLTPTKISELQFSMENELTFSFDRYIKLYNVIITPDYNNNMIEVRVHYKSLLSNESRHVSIYVDNRIKSEKFIYEDVEYIEENLESFVLLKLSSMGNKLLLYNIEEESWVWGRFRLLNLSHLDPFFSRILSLINRGI